MIDLVAGAKILTGAATKAFDYEEEDTLRVVDELRRRSYANSGNCLNPEIGSPEDRLSTKMVAKGYLVRVPFGYLLPEMVNMRNGSLY